MEPTTAIVDATRHTEANPPDTQVAGLGLLERTVRLAAVTGSDRALVCGPADLEERVDAIGMRLAEDDRFEIDLTFRQSREGSLGEVIRRAIEWVDVESEAGRILYVDSTGVYRREAVDRCLEEAASARRVCTLEGLEKPGGPRLFAAGPQALETLAGGVRESDGDSLAELTGSEPAVIGIDEEAPWIRVTDAASAERATAFVWDGCRKSADGPVSRYLNRPLSLRISDAIAPLPVTPNQISVVAGFFGLLSGVVGAAGGYFAFLGAGVAYQIKSIIDGVDGEIARGKYEFTTIGAWLDKIFDDLSDMSFAIGCAIGAWQMGLAGFGTESPQFWLAVIAVTVLGKLVDSLVYYGNAYRGDELVHPNRIFDWWFEADDGQGEGDGGTDESPIANVKLITRADSFTFLAFASAVVGIVPVYLTVFAVGQVAVGISRVRQARRQHKRAEEHAGGEASAEPSTS